MSGRPSNKRSPGQRSRPKGRGLDQRTDSRQRRKDAERKRNPSQVRLAQLISLPTAHLRLLLVAHLTLLQGSASSSVASNSGFAAPRSAVNSSATSRSVASGPGHDDGSGSGEDSGCSDDPAAAQRAAHKPWRTPGPERPLFSLPCLCFPVHHTGLQRCYSTGSDP